MPATLSVIVVAKNEAHDIADCLLSVKDFAHETIVFDSGSTDGTPEICRKLGAKVFETDWPGFGEQKNRAIDAASGDWILCIDADERIGPESAREIVSTINSANPAEVYRLPRSSAFCGKFIRHSGWWPDHVVRLFRRGAGRFEGAVHEKLIFTGTPGTLAYPIIHYAATDLDECVRKINGYSGTGAKMLHERGKDAGMITAVLRGGWAFFRLYFLKLGILDGREGFMIAMLGGQSSFLKYAKLHFLHRPAKPGKPSGRFRAS